MRHFLALVVALMFVLLSATAFAQDAEPDQKFYDFEEMLVDGELQSPDIIKTDPRGRAKFVNLRNLKKSFIPKVKVSAAEEALQ